MKPLYKRKRFWALIALLGLAILVVVLVALRKKKDEERPVIQVPPPTTTVRTESTDTSDGVVFKPLSLDMIKDSPSMAMMFLLEKVYSDDNPPTPLPSKQLLQSFFDFKYGRFADNISDDDHSLFRISFKITNFFLLEEGDLESLIDELKKEEKHFVTVSAHYGLSACFDNSGNMRDSITLFKDLTVFDPKSEAEKLSGDHYSTLLKLIRIIFNRHYGEEESKLELESFIIKDIKKILELVQLPSQSKLLKEMCGVDFDGLSLGKFQLLFMDFVNMPRAGPWINNNRRLISISQARIFAPLAKKYQLFSRSDIAIMAAIQVDILKKSFSVSLSNTSQILSDLYKHLEINPNGYFYYYLSQLLEVVEFPETVDFDLREFALPTKVCSLTQASYPGRFFDENVGTIERMMHCEDEAGKERNWMVFSIFPTSDGNDQKYNGFGFSFNIFDLDEIAKHFSLDELKQLHRVCSSVSSRVFSEAQKQKLVEIYNAGQFLLDQANYKPYFKDLGDLKNWPLYLLVTNLILLSKTKAFVQVFVNAGVDILEYGFDNLISCSGSMKNELENIWGKIHLYSLFSATKEYYKYAKDKQAYRVKWEKAMEIYNYTKSKHLENNKD